MKELKGKTAVITGAGSGIGRGIAHALAEVGTNIVVSDINGKTAQQVRSEVEQLGVKAIAAITDVRSREAVEQLAHDAYSAFGAVDILCNNAGVSWRPMRTIDYATEEDWRFIVDVNLWGVVHGIDAFLPRMRKQAGEKHIVNTSSLAALMPFAGHAPYSAAKSAVAIMSEAIAEELAPDGFGVTILCPNWTATNIAQNSAAHDLERGSANRTIPTYYNEALEKIFKTEPLPAISNGRMVKNAILNGQLYLHTRPLPAEFIAKRMEIMFGPNTIGVDS
jgi:NAD(P)-dependent dehydrogenase (short-subunit alcohol dehydrogenase family)